MFVLSGPGENTDEVRTIEVRPTNDHNDDEEQKLKAKQASLPTIEQLDNMSYPTVVAQPIPLGEVVQSSPAHNQINHVAVTDDLNRNSATAELYIYR